MEPTISSSFCLVPWLCSEASESSYEFSEGATAGERLPTSENIPVLLVEDNYGDYVLTRELIAEANEQSPSIEIVFSLEHCKSLSEARHILASKDIRIVLLDLSLPDANGLTGFKALQAVAPNVPIVLLTGLDDLELSAMAVYRGAQDYLVKGNINAKLLCRSLLYANERHRREQERMKHEQQLRNAERLKSVGIFTGGLAHDFNNILQGLIGNVSLASMKLPSEHPAQELLKRAQQAGDLGSNLIDQLLAFVGKGTAPLARVEIHKIITSTVEVLRNNPTRSLNLNVQLAENELSIFADSRQVTQVLVNLVSNAADASKDTDEPIRLSTGVCTLSPATWQPMYGQVLKSAGRYVFITVSDRGCGMSAETQAKLFEPFYSTKFTGRGLGLASVWGILQVHRALISVHSAEGRGTVISVYFPHAGETAL